MDTRWGAVNVIREYTKKHAFLTCLLAALLVNLFLADNAFALPRDYEVVAGSADFTVSDNSTLTINASNNTIVNYKSFDIAQNEKVIINLPDQSSQILNRVNSPLPTNIYGTLTSNGFVILVNESGIYLAPSANITAHNLVLSTRDITNQNFLSGNYLFEKISKETMDRLLLNEGTINITNGGFGVLIAGAAENRGIITARAGAIAMAAGDGVRLSFSGNGLVSIDITEPAAGAIVDYEGNSVLDRIKNSGALDAQGGTIMLAADSLNDIFRLAINLDGQLAADSLTVRADGTVRLTANVVAGNSIYDAPNTELTGADPYYFHGDVTFNGFECVVPGKEIYFEPGKTFTILGKFKIQGAYAELVKLISSEEGSQWFIDPQGERDLRYAWVKDSYNINPAEIVMTDSTSRGNNVNWDPDVYWWGNTDQYWSKGTNWSSGAPPGEGDDVSFNAALLTSTMDGNYIINSLTITDNWWNGDLTFNGNLTVKGSVNGYAIYVGNAKTVTFGSGNIELKAEQSGAAISLQTAAGGGNITTSAGGTNLTITTNSGNVALMAGSASSVLHGTGHTDITINTVNGHSYIGTIGSNAGDRFHKLSINEPTPATTGEVHLYGNITMAQNTADNDIVLKGDVKLEANVTLDTTANNGDISIGAVDGVTSARNFTAKSSDNIYVGAIGGAGNIKAVDFQAGNELHLYGGITTSNVAGNNVSLTGSVRLEDGITIDTDAADNDGDITITGAIDSASATARSLVLDAGTGGDIDINGAVGGTNHLNDLTITAANTVDFSGAVTIDDDFTLTAGAVTQNAAWAIGGDYSQAAGSFTDSRAAPTPADFTVTGSFQISGGTFDRYGNQVGGYYMVRDVYDLQAIAGGLTSDYKLSGNIDAVATDHWIPADAIFNGFSPIIGFAGTLDGDGNDIQNLHINRPFNSNIGLFSTTTSAATITDVDLTGVDIRGDNVVGALVGSNKAAVTNASSSGTVTSVNASSSRTGGLIGYNYGPINTSSSSVVVDAASFDVGGLVGYNKYDVAEGGADSGKITGCFATGTVTSDGDTVGGLVGYNCSGIITSCYATGDVTGGYAIGGLVGWNDTSYPPDPALGIVTDSSAEGKVTALTGTYNSGGLVGYNTGYISDSHAHGDVEGWDTVGGLVGCNGGDGSPSEHGAPVGWTRNSDAYGDVSGINAVGGLVGWNYTVELSDSDSSGNVTGSGDNVGGVAGKDDTIGGVSGITNSHSTGTTTLSGTDQDIETSLIYGNLTKTTLGTVTFTAGTTQTIEGTLTLTGTAGSYIKLRSGTTGTQWRIDPQGSRSVSYVDVQDSNNVSGTDIIPQGAINSGNNSGWYFGPSPEPTTVADIKGYERDTTPVPPVTPEIIGPGVTSVIPVIVLVEGNTVNISEANISESKISESKISKSKKPKQDLQ